MDRLGDYGNRPVGETGYFAPDERVNSRSSSDRTIGNIAKAIFIGFAAFLFYEAAQDEKVLITAIVLSAAVGTIGGIAYLIYKMDDNFSDGEYTERRWRRQGFHFWPSYYNTTPFVGGQPTHPSFRSQQQQSFTTTAAPPYQTPSIRDVHKGGVASSIGASGGFSHAASSSSLRNVPKGGTWTSSSVSSGGSFHGSSLTQQPHSASFGTGSRKTGGY